ncbi:DgyrCDS10782 [Dimorphilus gyrociliatus]|uniref:DgyrCDS10782 n=1 Tax=Dimorphilus gyrociliatus TaxID=2664684 RepID=A0A7I8W1A9_9ANNE|nr:DgyrCDS10782 [Dimorphilus gyrociliatus]
MSCLKLLTINESTFRSGKSTLLNFILHFMNNTTGSIRNVFNARYDSDGLSVTKGIDFLPTLYLRHNYGILFVDSQGLDSPERLRNNDHLILALLFRISSITIINIKDNLKQSEIEKLHLSISHRIQNGGSYETDQFSNLVFVIRDRKKRDVYDHGRFNYKFKFKQLEEFPEFGNLLTNIWSKESQFVLLPQPFVDDPDNEDLIHLNEIKESFKTSFSQFLDDLLKFSDRISNYARTGPEIIRHIEQISYDVVRTDWIARPQRRRQVLSDIEMDKLKRSAIDAIKTAVYDLCWDCVPTESNSNMRDMKQNIELENKKFMKEALDHFGIDDAYSKHEFEASVLEQMNMLFKSIPSNISNFRSNILDCFTNDFDSTFEINYNYTRYLDEEELYDFFNYADRNVKQSLIDCFDEDISKRIDVEELIDDRKRMIKHFNEIWDVNAIEQIGATFVRFGKAVYDFFAEDEEETMERSKSKLMKKILDFIREKYPADAEKLLDMSRYRFNDNSGFNPFLLSRARLPKHEIKELFGKYMNSVKFPIKRQFYYRTSFNYRKHNSKHFNLSSF